MKNLILGLIVFCLSALGTVNGQCGLSGPGTNGATATCGVSSTYVSTCNLTPHFQWSIGGEIDIHYNTPLPLSFVSDDIQGIVSGTVVSATPSTIRIIWDCATTSCGAITTIEHNGTEFFNPTVRIAGQNCGGCNELPTYQRYSYGKNRVRFNSNCGYCVTFDAYTSAGYFANQQVVVFPPYTTVSYSGSVYGIYNVQYYLDGNCPGVAQSQNKYNSTENAASIEYGKRRSADDLEKMDATPSFNIYPNPVNDIANIQFQKVLKTGTIEVYNSAGQLVHNMTIDGNDLIQLATGDWAKGIYLARLKNGATTQNLKFVIQ